MKCCGQDMPYTLEYEENPLPITRVRSKCEVCGRVAVSSVRGDMTTDVVTIELTEDYTSA